MILIFCCYSVLVYVLSNSIVLALDHDNNLVAKPEVQCGVDNIIVSMNTLLPFKGRLYVDGESEKENCVRHTEVGSKNLKFDISIGECNMRRQRTLHPRGIAFSFTLIVSFHPFFVTGQDKAFNIRCFFLESVKNLNTGLEVGILTTEVVEQDVPLPMCTYQLRGGDNGEKINFAQVGQKVTHVWHCDEEVSHVYGILIHSCYADDGRGNKFQLVDDQGCTTDPALLPQIEYESESITAVTHANVFKYADKVQLYFTCTVQLCYRHDGGCEGVTPPVCSHHSNGPPVQKFENQLDNIETHPENHDPSDKQNIPLSPPQKHSTLREDEAVMSPKPVILPSPNEMSRHFIGSLPKEIQLKAHNSMEFFNNIQKQSPRPPNHSREISNRDIHMSKLPYKDSPLNETEIEDIPTQDENTTGKSMKRPLLLPKNVGQVSNNDNSVGVKQRRHLKNMEADVSVEMLVLPPEIESKKETTNGSQFNIKSNNNVCLSKLSTLLIGAALLILIAFTMMISLFIIHRQRNMLKKIHHLNAFN